MAKENPNIKDHAKEFLRKMENTVTAKEKIVNWVVFRETSLNEYKTVFDRLGIHYDITEGESDYYMSARILPRQLAKHNPRVQVADEQIVCDLTGYHPDLGPTVLETKYQTSNYLTRDLNAIITRFQNHRFKKMIYVVGTDQSLHFQKLFALLQLAGMNKIAKRCEHIGFGRIGGMSTRKGTVILAKDILSEAKNRMMEQMKSNKEKFEQLQDPDHTAEIVSIAAVVIQDLSANRERDFTWKWSRVLVPYGRTGPGLLYCIVRLESISREVNEKWGWDEFYPDYDIMKMDSEEALSIGFHLASWPDTVKEAYDKLEPSVIVKYLLDLVQLVNDAYQKLRIITAEPETAYALLTLFWATKIILKKGANILGLRTLDRM